MRGPYSTPITPLTGSLFHADPQILLKDPVRGAEGKICRPCAGMARSHMRGSNSLADGSESHPGSIQERSVSLRKTKRRKVRRMPRAKFFRLYWRDSGWPMGRDDWRPTSGPAAGKGVAGSPFKPGSRHRDPNLVDRVIDGHRRQVCEPQAAGVTPKVSAARC